MNYDTLLAYVTVSDLQQHPFQR